MAVNLGFNHSFLAVHFVRLTTIESVQVEVTGKCKHEWLEYAIWQWEIGSETAFGIARAFNFVMFIVMGLASLFWFTSLPNRLCRLRVRLVSAILVLHLLAHLPFDLVLYSRSAFVISYVIQTAGFAVFCTLWALKISGFNSEHLKQSSEQGKITVAWLASGFLAFKAVTNELQLLTWPRAYDGSNPQDADFLEKNAIQAIIGYASYLLLIPLFDRLEQMENDQQWALFVDNTVGLFAIVANAVMFFNHFKSKKLVEHPVRRMVIAALWDVAAIYESVASTPTQAIGAVDDTIGVELEVER
jgi:hypothetical protein